MIVAKLVIAAIVDNTKLNVLSKAKSIAANRYDI